MDKILCNNCGSNDILFKAKYYECRHCNTKYRLPEEMREKQVVSTEPKVENFFVAHKRMIVMLLVAVHIISIGIYFFDTTEEYQEHDNYQSIANTPVMINNSHAQIGTQSIVINNYGFEQKKELKVDRDTSMYYWNRVLKEKGKIIDALTATKFDSYMMIANGMFLELDSKGDKIWSREIPLNYRSLRKRAITFKKNMVFSYGDRRSKNQTVIFDAQKKITVKLPIHFHSMVAVKDGFMGVTKSELKYMTIDGKERWSKSLKRMAPKYNVYNELVKLKDNSCVELGVDSENTLWISKYKQDGSLVWQHKTSTYKTFIKNVVATSDGGFILSAGRYIKIFKYNSQGELEWSCTKSKYRKVNAFSIVEAKDGYLYLSRLPNGFVVSKLDYEGNILWEQKYQGKKRILLNGFIKAFDGGYLLAIRNELGYSWLVKMSEQGEIRCDFDDERYRFNSNTKLLYRSQLSHQDKMVTVFKKTAGNCNRIRLSSDEKYLYATALAGGFYTFDISKPLNPKELSLFSKSKTKFHFYSNGAYGPVSRFGPELKGEYDYNNPQDFLISSDDKRAYVIDIVHGFYILNIENKQSPKLLASFKNLKGTSLTFLNGEKEILLPTLDVEKGELRLVSIDTQQPSKQHILRSIKVSKHTFDGYPLYRNYTKYPIKMIPLGLSNRVLLSYRQHIVLFDLKKESVIHEVRASNSVYSIALSPNRKLLYASSYNGTSIYTVNDLKLKNDMAFSSHFLKFSKNGNFLYSQLKNSSDVLVSNIADINNPRTLKVYKDTSASNIALSQNEKILYLASNAKGIGVMSIE